MTDTALTIADSLTAAIRNGRLAPGTRLPTHRDLAHRHGVALNTASHAMRLLAERGLAVGEVGRGSYVRAPSHVDGRSFSLDAATARIDLSRNVMPLPGLGDRFEAAVRQVLRRQRDALMSYQPHAGRDVDRVAASRWLARDGHLPDEPARVAVCAGAQHAIAVSLLSVARPGDVVAVEALTWPGIQATAAALGLTLLPVPMDGQGLRPRALLRLAARRRVAAVYCMPTLQNPTMVTMPLARRQLLVQLARRLDVQIIEDAAYSFLAPDAPPPIAALAPERTWHVRSLSKSMTPGLRTAWLMTPPGATERAAAAIRGTVWSVPPLGPAVAAQWIADGTAVDLERIRQVELDTRLAMAGTLLGIEPAGRSMHLWLPLPGRLRAQALTDQAAAGGVRVSPGAAFSLDAAPNAVRLSIGAPPDRALLAEGLGVIARLCGIAERP